ncbi:hypothetical protein EUGRSUZ_J01986 [Eucalyptus grandis]|uniref:Uncharacterized protein n=2 Tax=Eucalyptus grandis TaxID=71139 RepID=A0ACC3J734_EUCGR|nr:hypothetical protein EUGRSUZ_J01986 [Eucalyptus grandis]
MPNTKTLILATTKKLNLNLTRDVNGLDRRLLLLHLGNSDGEHPVLHRGLHPIHLRILGQPKPPHELPAASLHPVPRVVLVFLLHIPLAAYLEHPIVFDLHLDFLFLEPGEIRLEHVGFWGLLPVDPCVGKSGVLPEGLREIRGGEGGGWEREVLEGVPEVERERVEDVAAPAAEPAWDERHRILLLLLL